MPPSTIKDIIELFRQKGDSEYGGEKVTQLEHALQTAFLAMQEQASAALIAAALLHDIGHLIHDLPDDAPNDGIDDRHEVSGYHYLVSLFGPAVTEPVRLHVPAKRYLCAVDEGYMRQLSEPSLVSLTLQGGPMNGEEVNRFFKLPFADDAVRLRKWDDQAKVVGLPTPSLDEFADYLRQAELKGDS
jgi:phosphonate degradation associated HDIG domain protein